MGFVYRVRDAEIIGVYAEILYVCSEENDLAFDYAIEFIQRYF